MSTATGFQKRTMTLITDKLTRSLRHAEKRAESTKKRILEEQREKDAREKRVREARLRRKELRLQEARAGIKNLCDFVLAPEFNRFFQTIRDLPSPHGTFMLVAEARNPNEQYGSAGYAYSIELSSEKIIILQEYPAREDSRKHVINARNYSDAVAEQMYREGDADPNDNEWNPEEKSFHFIRQCKSASFIRTQFSKALTKKVKSLKK